MSLEALGVIGWNVRCNASARDQFTHLEKLEDRLRARGSAQVLLCLSEVTTPFSVSPLASLKRQTLADLMQSQGYEITSRPTTYFKDGSMSENLAIASRDPALARVVAEAVFHDTGLQRAQWFKPDHWRNRHRFHERRVGHVSLNGLQIYTTHASFHTPGKKERQAILAAAGNVNGTNRKLLIGDFNTAFDTFLREAAVLGWRKLKDPARTSTWYGWELDHAFVTPALRYKSQLEIVDRGPSDHRPLLVTIEADPYPLNLEPSLSP